MLNSSFISLIITSVIYLVVGWLAFFYTPTINLDKISTKSDTTVVTLVKAKKDGKSLVNSKEKIKSSNSKPSPKKSKNCCKKDSKQKEKIKQKKLINLGEFKASAPQKKPHSKASATLSITQAKNSLKSTAKRGGKKEVNLFFKEIKKAIAKNKIYPKRARRKGIRGRVKATFTIEQNGSISNIALKGKRMFFDSAKRAIKKIEPINTKDAPISLPIRVSITIKFRLK